MKVLAVSGGVDSMVMLDLMCQKYPHKELLVAHFDHNSRPSSKTDREFIRRYCQEYGLKFVTEVAPEMQKKHLSELEARQMRYDFLRRVSEERKNALIYTAQHLDDLVESIAINLIRGTGWRGLAVMNRSGLVRPLLDGSLDDNIYDRRDILRYASQNSISFRQDPTNSDNKFLRNYLRPNILALPRKTKEKLLNLRNQQYQIAQAVQENLETITPKNTAIPRQLFADLPEQTALELLRMITENRALPCTRPQLQNFLVAIKAYRPGKKFNLPKDTLVEIGRSYFKF